MECCSSWRCRPDMLLPDKKGPSRDASIRGARQGQPQHRNHLAPTLPLFHPCQLNPNLLTQASSNRSRTRSNNRSIPYAVTACRCDHHPWAGWQRSDRHCAGSCAGAEGGAGERRGGKVTARVRMATATRSLGKVVLAPGATIHGCGVECPRDFPRLDRDVID